jgi:hypothetical protein
MIRMPADPAADVETFRVSTSADHVEIAADRAGVGVSVIDGEYVALVPCAIGFLKYAAPVPADEVAS